MNATQQKAEFKEWLKSKDGGDIAHTTANCYISAINAFQKEILDVNYDDKDFYSCRIDEIETAIAEEKPMFDILDKMKGGALNSAINKYRSFLKSTPAFAPVVLHKAPQNIDVTQYVTESLLVNLFIKTYKTNFPGYEIYREAQGRNCAGFSVLLEHPAEKKALFVVLVPQSTDSRQDLFQHISADYKTLRELFHKAEETLSVLVIAGQFELSFKEACILIPDIRLMRYSLGALALQDE